MHAFRRLCVYCGSSNHVASEYKAAARRLGTFLAERNIEIVYGGGSVGLMNEVAEGGLEAGGHVIGVIPEQLLKLELAHARLSELIVVSDMHARKRTMAELADGFIALPGGYGTLEELFEATTWSQLQIHDKPVGLLNVEGYFDRLLSFVDHAVQEGFVRPAHRPLLSVHTDPETLLVTMRSTHAPNLREWIADP